MTGKYMAYVGSYSYTGKAKGITVYDVDVEKGQFIYRCEVEVDNSSYLKASNSGKVLYSIADEGVVAFQILQNGSLNRLNSVNIKGMRGCHISISPDDSYLFISGYHDGKITVVKLNEDGSVGCGEYELPFSQIIDIEGRFPHSAHTKRHALDQKKLR